MVVALSRRDTQLMHRVFERVMDNSRVLRTAFQMVRSGQFGRKVCQAHYTRRLRAG